MTKKLTLTDSVATGDLFVIWKTADGDYRGAPASDVLTFFQNNLTFPSFTGQEEYTSQYAAPSATGFSVTITDGVSDNTNVHLILTPTAGYAAGTIVLPPVAGLVDKQEVLVNCTQQVTALTIDANGATAVTGEPTSLAADDFFRLKYDAVFDTWFRVG